MYLPSSLEVSHRLSCLADNEKFYNPQMDLRNENITNEEEYQALINNNLISNHINNEKKSKEKHKYKHLKCDTIKCVPYSNDLTEASSISYSSDLNVSENLSEEFPKQNSYMAQSIFDNNLYKKQISFYSLSKLSPYDICEMHVHSLHQLDDDRECLRIIGVAAGESLHNIYRIIMASLGQREDRTRLVAHAWILPDGRVYGYGPRYSNMLKSIGNDREIYLNDLPICIKYQLGFIFGKCVYLVTVHDIIRGLTDEHDLIWIPRLCEGSFGEPVPFDLCYSPHLFTQRTLMKEENFQIFASLSLEKTKTKSHETTTSSKNKTLSNQSHLNIDELCPKYSYSKYMTDKELYEINLALSKMRFIRQNSQIKPLLRKNRTENILLHSEYRQIYFHMTPRNFFCTFWLQQLSRKSLQYSSILQNTVSYVNDTFLKTQDSQEAHHTNKMKSKVHALLNNITDSTFDDSNTLFKSGAL